MAIETETTLSKKLKRLREDTEGLVSGGELLALMIKRVAADVEAVADVVAAGEGRPQ